MSDDDGKKLDYLAKYRGGEEELVENAQMLTFSLLEPKPIEGNAYNFISFAYSLLNRVDYFNGRRGEVRGEETIQITFANGRVIVNGFFLEKLHRRILRREVETIPEVYLQTQDELAAIRSSKDERCTVVSLLVFLTDDDAENDGYPPQDETNLSEELEGEITEDGQSDE